MAGSPEAGLPEAGSPATGPLAAGLPAVLGFAQAPRETASARTTIRDADRPPVLVEPIGFTDLVLEGYDAGRRASPPNVGRIELFRK